jgi:RNA polymerase sigma factor (sigma-70 family)
MDRSALGSTLQHLSALVAPPGARDLTDSELLSAYCANHDQAAFAAIVQRHGPLVLAVCGRVLRHVEDREDVFQATFLALARDAASVRRRESIAGWLHGVARHIALDAHRAATRRHKLEEQAMTTPAPNPAFDAAWHEVQVMLDEEIQRLPPRYREPFVLCCLEDHSRAEAAARLGVKEGTVGSRLAEARRRLRAKLALRGVELTAVLAATAVVSGAARASVPAALAATVTGIAVRMTAGQALTPQLVSARILSLVQGVPKAMFLTNRMLGTLILIAAAVVGSGVTAVAYHHATPGTVAARRHSRAIAVEKLAPRTTKADNAMWTAQADFKTPGWLPGSVAYSAGGKMMVIGGTDGKVVAIDPATRKDMWKADVGGSFAAVAFAADGKSVLATFKDGVRFLDADTGKAGDSLEKKESRPTAVGVFPNREIDGGGNRKITFHKVIFANRQHYFVYIWAGSVDKAGTITLGTSAKDTIPLDASAIPLAVDPEGRSAIVTGPIDRDTGKNVLWAWVAGDGEKGSPGNRLLKGHEAVVVSAAWSKDGKTAVTGDAGGRVIVWDAKIMKEAHRLELGGRIAAVALSMDGKNIAAVTVGKLAKFYAWQTSKPKKTKPIHVDSGDFSGPIHACLAFSPDGGQLAGSAMNTDWLTRFGDLVGTVHLWKAEKTGSEKEAEK